MRFRRRGRPTHRQKRAALAVVGALVAAGLLLVVLGPVSWLIAGDTVRGLPGKEKADAINAVRQTILAAIGGAAVIGGLAFTARTYALTKRGQVTERFSRAVELLTSEHVEERLGAIYSLEHVLAESPQDHVTVVNLLAQTVRNRTRPADFPEGLDQSRSHGKPLPAFGVQPSADVDAALRILAVRPDRPEPFRLDLRHVTLPGLYIRDFEFDAPPSFRSAFFTWADLRHSAFRGLDLTNAIFTEADMRGCLLVSAQMDGAVLSRADLRGARFKDASLLGAFLDGADLRDSDGLTPEQLSGALIDGSTQLPPELAADGWVRARLAAMPAEATSTVPPPTPRPA
ncbi:pentapeptide repeat-containing protein [Streptomyces sp. NPDC048057]|uniref:pentapeptide repeat-containing protein n=1 Tax=Streptomyces sp. NPDC048057 TaxID=3155628 RepID=UPI0033D6D7F9